MTTDVTPYPSREAPPATTGTPCSKCGGRAPGKECRRCGRLPQLIRTADGIKQEIDR